MQSPYRFGRAELRPVERELRIDGEPVEIGGRAFDLLQVLVERRERVVTKDELLELVWPGPVVEEHNLYVQINTLRKLVGPGAVLTIPGRGYRFALPVRGELPASVQRVALGTSTAEFDEAPTKGNVPAEIPPLYGRETEIGEVLALVRHHRLVSIVGAGGIGKSRLAEAVAHRLRGTFANGIWIVQLAALTDGTQLASTMAQTLRVTVSVHSNAVDSVIDALRATSQLVVLDNCEHLVGALSALVPRIQQGASGLTLLTTSQVPLRTAEERVYRLNTLSTPSPSSALSVATASNYGAVALFVARAQATDHRFVLAPQNVGLVIDVCRQLDGIALAIELAAARVLLLGIAGIHA